MRKQNNYDKAFKQMILKLYENGKSLKELLYEYLIPTQSIEVWKRHQKNRNKERKKSYGNYWS